MATTSETGHAKNVANFEDLISFCTGYSTTYNPSKASIKLTALNTVFNNSKNSLMAVSGTLIPFNNATNTREINFAPLNKLVTRIISALDATDASKQTINDANNLARKIQGRRAKAKKDSTQTTSELTPGLNPIPVNNEVQNISASQMSFDSRIENFHKLITLLANEPLYIPNEADLKLTALNALLTSLKTSNTSVVSTTTALSNARISRNKSLYQTSTGLYDIQQEVKKYVKSVFGTNSPEYKQISGIKFTNPR